jgi:D(-)-tartrate dehydratase
VRIVEIRERTVPLGAAMRNASIAFDTMTASALSLVSDQGLNGHAFDSIGRYGKGALLRERFIPRLLNAAPGDLVDEAGVIVPEACVRIAMANEKDGGHGERPGAVGLIEAAAWDLRAKAQGLPLWKCLASHFGFEQATARIEAYASCGHYRRGDDSGLAPELRAALDAGYRCVKIKLGGADVGEDLQRVGRAVTALTGEADLAVDVNGSLAPGMAQEWFGEMAAFGLAWIEEPAAPLDYEALASYARISSAPIATGENLFSFDDARNLLRYGGLRAGRDFIQIDPLLAYGVGEYVRILKLYEAAGWSRRSFMPHAGHLFAAHCVAGLGLGRAEVAPDASLAYGGLWDGVRALDGTIAIPDLPGVGFEAKQNLFREFP